MTVAVNRTLLELQDLADSAGTPEENLDSHLAKYADVQLDNNNNASITIERVKHSNVRKKYDRREVTQVSIMNLKNANENTALAASNHKKDVAVKWMDVIRHRFADFQNDIYRDVAWLDRLSWTDDSTYGNTVILNLAAHFDSLLNYNGLVVDDVLKEWKSCKRFVQVKFPNPETCNIDIWKYVLTRIRDEFPNVCCIVALLLSISVSDSTVERKMFHHIDINDD